MDIYYILGLKNNCSTEDIIKKYEKFSKKYNPTNNRNLSNYEIIKFKEFTKEYKKILSQRISDTSDFSLDNIQNNIPNNIQNNIPNNIQNNIHKIISYTHNSELDIIKSVDITLNELYNNKNICINYQKYNNNKLENDIYSFNVLKHYDYIDSKTIIINNKGNINNNEFGNLCINFNILEHIMFIKDKDKNNLIYKKNISIADALCGFVFYIQHIDNHIIKVDMNNKIILGVNTYWVIKNEGLPIFNKIGNKVFGDIYIEFIIDYPDSISITNYQRRVLIDLFSGICSLNPTNIKFDKSIKPSKLLK